MKYHPHGSVLFITFSLEEGLFLLSNPLCKILIQSCLARAQFKYPLRICHYVIEATHIHLLVVVDNPTDVPAFIGHFKTESAHGINRILGRKIRTVWCEGYDSPIVLSLTKAIEKIAYIYSNPSNDNLVDTIDQYPGLSSWKMFQTGAHNKSWAYIRRPAFAFLEKELHNLSGYTREAQRLAACSNETHEFKLDPNAWMETFGISTQSEQQRLNCAIVSEVRAAESRNRQTRIATGKSVIGTDRLLTQSLNPYHQPRRSGRRTLCLSEDKAERRGFIQFLKCIFREARRISRKWLVGDFTEAYPLGLYPPSMPKLAEPLTCW